LGSKLGPLSRHPFDWAVHFGLCLAATATGWAAWWVVLFVGALIEYEQKFQVWTYEWTWHRYLLYCSLGDLVADIMGIGVGVWLRTQGLL
jgi:hypothetical protein